MKIFTDKTDHSHDHDACCDLCLTKKKFGEYRMIETGGQFVIVCNFCMGNVAIEHTKMVRLGTFDLPITEGARL